jgi:ABC-type sugar transport system, periplasmic component
MKKRGILATILVVAMMATMLAGCGSKADAAGKVYYLNFKPEVAEVWTKIAEEYTKATGVEVKVQTAAAGTYESTLKSEVAKKNPPTLFQINGPVGYQSWKDYCLDLKDTELFKNLSDPTLAVKDGEGVFGIPYVVEGYGIIYNDKIMRDYFALADKAVDISSSEEIDTFDKLKAVAEDMTNHKEELGIEGVFSSTSFSPGEDWRWQTHLANLPIFYEYKADGVDDKDELDFSYADGFRGIFDLYIHNSAIEPGLVGSKTVNDSMAEFALGKTAMVQNGNWGWGQISEVDGNVVDGADVKFLPIYIGAQGEEQQGLCVGTENFFAVNAKVSEADQQATIDFVNWLFTSPEGKKHIVEDLGFIAPFNTFGEDEMPQDPLAKEIMRFMNDGEKNNVAWAFLTFPSQTFKDKFGSYLLEYAQGTREWDAVVTDMKADWASEKAAASAE